LSYREKTIDGGIFFDWGRPTTPFLKKKNKQTKQILDLRLSSYLNIKIDRRSENAVNGKQ
jgi:hypothetical protein